MLQVSLSLRHIQAILPQCSQSSARDVHNLYCALHVLTDRTLPCVVQVGQEEYNTFFTTTFREFLEPLAQTHFSVEGTIEFSALLFVPGMAPFEQQVLHFPHGTCTHLHEAFVVCMHPLQHLLVRNPRQHKWCIHILLTWSFRSMEPGASLNLHKSIIFMYMPAHLELSAQGTIGRCDLDVAPHNHLKSLRPVGWSPLLQCCS